RASIGSIPEARRAGTYPAAAATTAKSTDATTNVTASFGLSPNSNVAAARPAQSANPTPITSPAASSIMASRSTRRTTLAIGAQRHAYPDLVLPPRHHVGDHAVEPDRG